MNTCRDCDEVLSDKNWAASRRAKKDYLCTKCASARQKQRKASDPEHAEKIREYHKSYSADYRTTDKRKEYEAAYRITNAAKRKLQMREWRLKKVFGISLQEFDSMLEKQGGTCAICHITEPTGVGNWHIDHCHTTGRIRGLLCSKCNHVLGLVNDDRDTLFSAINYLDKTNENSPDEG